MDNLNTIIQNKFLLRALQNCNVTGVENALKRGANPNIMMSVGEYTDETEGDVNKYKTYWKGVVSVHPVIWMAKRANDCAKTADEEAPYKKIIAALINHPKTNLDVAVLENVKIWDFNDTYLYDSNPDNNYHHVLNIQEVLDEVSTIYRLGKSYSRERLYHMSQSMVTYIQNTVDETQRNNPLAQAKLLTNQQVQY